MTRHIDHGVLGVEIAVCVFEGVGNSRDLFDYAEAFEKVDIDLAGVADKTENRFVMTLAAVNVEAAEPGDKIVELSGVSVFFQKYYHFN